MSELIADMLRLSDVERGDKPQISTDVDLRKIADDVVSVLSVKAEQKHVSLFAEGTAFAKIDKTDARELIENLASNPDYAAALNDMRKILKEWMDATLDCVPENPTKDSFDRETGKRLLEKNQYSDDYAGKKRRAEYLLCPQ